MKKANVRAGLKRTIKYYKPGSNATSQGKGRGRQLSAREQLELSRRRSRTVELAASGLDLRECAEVLKSEGFADVHFTTVGRDVRRARAELNRVTQVTVAQDRDQMRKDLRALIVRVNERDFRTGGDDPSCTRDLLAIYAQISRLLGLNADTRVTVAVETTDPKKMKLYQRFLWESRGVEEADFEKVWELLASLAKPLGVIDSSCLPPQEDDDNHETN